MLAETYALYLALSIAITIWVGYTLHHNGRVFLIAVFKENLALADSINNLLLVGFYLINFGFISLTLKSTIVLNSPADMIEFLSAKVEFIIVVLGVMHFFNMYVLVRFRNFKLFDAQNAVTQKPAIQP